MPAASDCQRLRATCPLIPSYPPHGAPPVAPRMRPHLPVAVLDFPGPLRTTTSRQPRSSHTFRASSSVLCPSPPIQTADTQQRHDRLNTHAHPRCQKLIDGGSGSPLRPAAAGPPRRAVGRLQVVGEEGALRRQGQLQPSSQGLRRRPYPSYLLVVVVAPTIRPSIVVVNLRSQARSF